MKLRPIGPNVNEVTVGELTVLFSYQTPVAAFVPGEGYLVTDKKWSKTTSRHINKWLASMGVKTAVKVSQERLNAIVALNGGEGGEYNRNPGKFSDSIEELLYALDHAVLDQTVGSTDELGWYGLVSDLTRPEARKLAEEFGVKWDNDDADQYDWPLNAIIREDSDGFVTVNTFKQNRDAIREWRDVEEEYERYYEAGGG
jgi:hypothetical protein